MWVCEPTSIGEDETPTEFANRVQQIIADRAKITAVPWDGTSQRSIVTHRTHALFLCRVFEVHEAQQA